VQKSGQLQTKLDLNDSSQGYKNGSSSTGKFEEKILDFEKFKNKKESKSLMDSYRSILKLTEKFFQNEK
jgi:hypothetical protein